MNFEEFENLARLYIVGVLEGEELAAFNEARIALGERGDQVIAEFRRLNSVFALSLQPHPPHPETKRKLLREIRESLRQNPGGGDGEDGFDCGGGH